MTTQRTQAHQLQVATPLYDFINQQVLPDLGISQDSFWQGFDQLVADLATGPLRGSRKVCERKRPAGVRPLPTSE